MDSCFGFVPVSCSFCSQFVVFPVHHLIIIPRCSSFGQFPLVYINPSVFSVFNQVLSSDGCFVGEIEFLYFFLFFLNKCIAILLATPILIDADYYMYCFICGTITSDLYRSCKLDVQLVHNSFFQQLTHIFKTLPLFLKTLHTNPRIAHKMQNASHLLQNEALHSKYHKHLFYAANTFSIILYFWKVIQNLKLFFHELHFCRRLKVIGREIHRKHENKIESKPFLL